MIIKFNPEQQRLLSEAGINCPADNDFSEDQLLEMEETVSDYMLSQCLDKEQNMTEKAHEYREILNMLAE